MSKIEPFFHPASGTVRFWVPIDTSVIGASISKETLQYRYRPNMSEGDPLATYAAHQAEIDEAVRRRVAKGSIEPVMLREYDIPPVPRN